MDTQETNLYLVILIVLAIFTIIIIYFIISIIRMQRKQTKLDEKIMNDQISVLEDDRSRIASDLHDNIGPMLSAIKLKINLIQTQDEQSIQNINTVSQNIDDAIKELRFISYNLMPNILVMKGLIPAIKEYIQKFFTNLPFKTDFDFQEDIEMEKNIAINIFRILQEIMHNTMKHSYCTNYHLSIKAHHNTLYIDSRDNGVGFDTNNMEHKEGMGLKNIYFRVRMLNGRLNLLSEETKGTLMSIVIPIKDAKTNS